MRNFFMMAIAAGILTACGPTTTKTASELSITGCSGYERGRLAGLRAGAKLRPSDPSTEHGRRMIEEDAYLAMICEGGSHPKK